MFDEQKLIRSIFMGMDWQEVLSTIVIEEGMDPWVIDIVKLTDTFVSYLHRLQTFDFRVPGRFILIAAVLLRMKCEILFQEEEESRQAEEMPPIKLDAPQLAPPIERRPTRKVTLQELVDALNKAMEFKERKEGKKIRMRRAVETLIGEEEEDIEERIAKIFTSVKDIGGTMPFSRLVPSWSRKEIVSIFIPLLHLMMRNSVEMMQEEMFKDITVSVKHGINEDSPVESE